MLASLSIPSTKANQRHLTVSLRSVSDIACSVYAPGEHGRQLAFCCGALTDARLNYLYGYTVLWIGSGCINLLPDEASEAERIFGPHGLRIVKEQTT